MVETGDASHAYCIPTGVSVPSRAEAHEHLVAEGGYSSLVWSDAGMIILLGSLRTECGGIRR